MTFDLFGAASKDDIRVGYIDPTLGYVGEVTICEANDYAQKNPGTTFVFRNGDNNLEYLNVNEVNQLTPDRLVSVATTCGGFQEYKECGPPRIQFFGGGGIGAVGNPIVGIDGALLAVDIVRGGNGYQFAPLVAAKDDCQLGNGAVLTAVLGEVSETTETYEGETDFEEYELCADTDVGYGRNYGPDGEDLGPWEPQSYTTPSEDPIAKEIETYQKIIQQLKNPFWTTRKKQPISIKSLDRSFSKYDVSFPDWNDFMNSYAISPVSPSNVSGSDYAGRIFTFEWEENFPLDGEYTFRGLCDNNAELYIDDFKLSDLKSFADAVIPIQKTLTSGNHKIRIDLLNLPIVEKLAATLTSEYVEVDFNVYGQVGGGKEREPFLKSISFAFTSEDGKDSFVITGPDKNKGSKVEKIKIRPNINYKVVASEDARKYKGVEQGLIKNGTKAKEAGVGSANKIFADYLGSKNDNDDLQITVGQGIFTSSNKRKAKGSGRSTYDLTYSLGEVQNSQLTSLTKQVVSSKSWNENPMGVALTIDAPAPVVPQEKPPAGAGRCPPNPIWSTRFPNSTEQWYPVHFNAPNTWSKFMNRYALSPIQPLDTAGSDRSGVTFSNNWDVDLPYSGFYGVKGTRDNNGRLLVDGIEVSELDGFNVSNPKLTKVYLTKGKHKITTEIFNAPVETTSIVKQKIFSTKDWQIAPANVDSGPVEVDFNVYGQVGGGKEREPFLKSISFAFTSEDGKDSFVITGPDKNKGTRIDKIKIRPNVNYKVVASEDARKYKGVEQGLIKNGTKAKEAGIGNANKIFADYLGSKNDNDDLQITAGKGIFTSSNKRKAKGSGRSTYDLTYRLDSSSISSSNTSKNGITYSGPTLFAYTDKRWGNFMNVNSISPKVFNKIDVRDNKINGTFTLTWSGVNFPEDGQYDIKFGADNIAILKIGGKQVQKTTDYVGQPQVFKTNVNTGIYDVSIELTNIKDKTDIFTNNPMGVALIIEKDVAIIETSATPWTTNPIGISAILIPPPCPKKISGKGVVSKVIVEDPGNGYIPKQDPTAGYPVTLKLVEVIVENPGINYNCGVDKIKITPDNGAVLSYTCSPFGKITSVTVENGGVGFTEYPTIEMTTLTGVNASFRPVFEVIRDPLLPPDKLIQVTDLVGIKRTGYVDGRAYYGAVYYENGLKYAGYYKTIGAPIRIYDTLQESITAKVTTPASAIERSGTDVTSNDPLLNIPGTPENLI